jgi:hypothetical protein
MKSLSRHQTASRQVLQAQLFANLPSNVFLVAFLDSDIVHYYHSNTLTTEVELSVNMETAVPSR